MTIAMAAGMMLLITSLRAADQVVVYVDSGGVVDHWTLRRAEGLATRMFARIGVSVQWYAGKQPREDTEAIAASLVSGVPEQFYPGALGYATIFPQAAGRVFVLVDRVKRTVEPALLPALLAHVLVHEITHVLEGESRHAEKGVMKAHWTEKDYIAMDYKPLEFTPIDVGLVHYGLAHR